MILLDNTRPVPRVANLDAKVSDRITAWRERCRAAQEPPDSIVERESTHPWRWVTALAVFFSLACASLFAPLPVQAGVGVGLVVVAFVALRQVTR